MTWSVYQPWDPLKVCIVGKTYLPEFYQWIKQSRLRKLFEKIAIETEEDLQNLIKVLEKFNVKILRPDLPNDVFSTESFTKPLKPPLTPRDYTGMIGETFYYNNRLFISKNFSDIYNGMKAPSWPECNSMTDFRNLPVWIQEELLNFHNLKTHLKPYIFHLHSEHCYDNIINEISKQKNSIKQNLFKNIKNDVVNRAQIFPMGRDLFVGTTSLQQNCSKLLNLVNYEFTKTRNHIINSGGHLDGCISPIAPGLIFRSPDIDLKNIVFPPDWEIVTIPPPDIKKLTKFRKFKEKTIEKWWIPGYENDSDVIELIENYFSPWLGQISETIFNINLLVIDPKNIITTGYNRQIEKICHRYGITVHVVPFRHMYFWDSGIHCLTSDLNREGSMQDYFLERNYVQ